MKKNLILGVAIAMIFTVSCDPNTKNVQEEDKVSEEILEGDSTPSQYEGSTGVIEDDQDNNMDANENIQLKKQDFKGSFASPKTQNYELTVIEAEEFTFRIESENPDVKYIVLDKDGKNIIEETRESKTVMLEPNQYIITATMDLEEGEEASPDTEFIVYID